jgi:hypothetical protein
MAVEQRGSHPPEVLRALCERLRREWRPVPTGAADASGPTYELERDDVAAAVGGGILEIDKWATTQLRGELLTDADDHAPGTVYYSKHGTRRAFVRK